MATKTAKYSLDNIKNVGDYYYTDSTGLCMPKLLQSLLSSNNLVLRDFEASGLLVKDLSEVFELFTKAGARCLVNKPNSGEFIFVWPDHSFAGVGYNDKSKIINIHGSTTNPKIEKLGAVLKKDFVTQSKKNMVFAVIRTSQGFDITNMGDGSSPLITDNYTPEVLADVDHVVESFQKSPPPGRIAILNGEPGTGKTFLIRSMLSRMDCVFLIIPSGLMGELDKPELLPLLLNVKKSYEKPIVMVIEDGDVCLVPRKNDNISTIASLLNLSDGILGTMIDIKMIISTNAHIKDMDKAILRPGRLCRDIHVAALPYEQANKVYQRLTGNKENMEYGDYYTLAEIYDMVNNPKSTGLTTSKPKRKPIGFLPGSTTPEITLNKVGT